LNGIGQKFTRIGFGEPENAEIWTTCKASCISDSALGICLNTQTSYVVRIQKVMTQEEYKRAVAIIAEDVRGVGIVISQVPLGSKTVGLNVRMQTGEEFPFRAFEEFMRWWSQLLQGQMTMQRVKEFLEDRGHNLK
jgi:hypothetical protein